MSKVVKLKSLISVLRNVLMLLRIECFIVFFKIKKTFIKFMVFLTLVIFNYF